MPLKSSAAVAALVLGLTASADAVAASAACRQVDSGAVDRVCRYPVGKGEFVNVYYGHPPPAAPPKPAPVRNEVAYAPPVYYAAPAYYGYGYLLPVAVGAGGRRWGVRPHAGPMFVGRGAAFHGGGRANPGGGFQARGWP